MGKTEVIEGDIARPVQIINGNNRNYGEVGQPLKDIIRQGLFFTGPLHAQMIGYDARDRFPGELAPQGQKILANVLCEQAGDSL
jgi:hypothetical protein